jgi:hypothetical protein
MHGTTTKNEDEVVRKVTVVAWNRGRGIVVDVEEQEGKRPLGRPRRRGEDNVKRDLQEVGGGSG